MLNLLVRSLIADGGIEEAIMTAISDVEVSTNSSKEQPIIADMAATPVLQLVQQLLNNLTIQQLTYFKQVKNYCKSKILEFCFNYQLSDVTMGEEDYSSAIQLDRPAIELLLVFQRTVQAVIFAEYMKMTETQDKEKGESIM